MNDELSEGAAEVEGLEHGISVTRRMKQGYVSESGGRKEGETYQVFPNYEVYQREWEGRGGAYVRFLSQTVSRLRCTVFGWVFGGTCLERRIRAG